MLCNDFQLTKINFAQNQPIFLRKYAFIWFSCFKEYNEIVKKNDRRHHWSKMMMNAKWWVNDQNDPK
jgi:hypothetical protein